MIAIQLVKQDAHGPRVVDSVSYPLAQVELARAKAQALIYEHPDPLVTEARIVDRFGSTLYTFKAEAKDANRT